MRLALMAAFALILRTGLSQDISVTEERNAIEILLANEVALDSIVEQALLNSYSLHGYRAELLQQHENVRQEKNRWLSTFRVGVNFFSLSNTANAQDQTITRVGVLPAMGFSLALDPEKFVNRGSYIREARENVVRAEGVLNQQRKMLRIEIVSLYYQYLENLGIVELRQLSVENQQEMVHFMEAKFKSGEGRLEDLLNGQTSLGQAKESLLRAELAVRKTKEEIKLLTSDSERYFAAHEK